MTLTDGRISLPLLYMTRYGGRLKTPDVARFASIISFPITIMSTLVRGSFRLLQAAFAVANSVRRQIVSFVRWYIRYFHTERRVTYDKSGRSKLPGLGFETALIGVHMTLAVGHFVFFLQG